WVSLLLVRPGGRTCRRPPREHVTVSGNPTVSEGGQGAGTRQRDDHPRRTCPPARGTQQRGHRLVARGDEAVGGDPLQGLLALLPGQPQPAQLRLLEGHDVEVVGAVPQPPPDQPGEGAAHAAATVEDEHGSHGPSSCWWSRPQTAACVKLR